MPCGTRAVARPAGMSVAGEDAGSCRSSLVEQKQEEKELMRLLEQTARDPHRYVRGRGYAIAASRCRPVQACPLRRCEVSGLPMAEWRRWPATGP